MVRTQEYWDIDSEEGIHAEATITTTDSPGKEIIKFFVKCSDIWYIN